MKKKIKSLTKSLDNLHAEGQFQGLVRKFLASDEFSRVEGELLSLAVNVGCKHELSMHQTKEEFVDVLEKISQFAPEAQEKLACLANVPASRDACVSPSVVKESTMTPASASLELPSNIVSTSSDVVLEPNEQWVNAMVDRPNHEMTYRVADANLGSVCVCARCFLCC
nr:hypothetical protein [Tanacetum cinerariifolium]